MEKMTRVERILDPFGARHGHELVVFFNKVAETNFDTIVFIARKALCLYRLMELCGVKKPTATLCSDAILDDPIQFSGKKILVVDDTLFVGTTLADIKQKIIKYGPEELVFWVYCVDKDTWNLETFAPDYIHTQNTSQEIIEFCAAECRSMINAGIPYLTDFALSRRIGLYPSELDASIKPVNWYFYDISSQYHESNKVKYYSAIPNNYINHEVRQFVGPQIFDLIEIAKLRIFATWTSRRYDVTLVPVVTFGSIKTRDIKCATYALLSSFQIDEKLVSSSSTNELVRVLQFLVGAVYLNTYFSHLDSIKNVKASEKLDYSICSAVFRTDLALAISTGIAKLYDGSLTTIYQKLPPLRTGFVA